MPRIVARLTAISESLQNGYEGADPIDNKIMGGFGYMLEDIVNDIEVINHALYGNDEKEIKATAPEPDTAPISEQ
jgi:hypothetical protein